MKQVKAGEDYFGVECAACKTPIPIFEAHGKDIKFAGPGKFKIKCPTCQHEALYGTGDMQRFIAAVLH